MEYNDKFRLYGLVPYQLTGIQQGIQFGHALQEYNNFVRNNPDTEDSKNFKEWSENCKTFIVLNGGTTNDKQVGLDYFGTLNNHVKTLHIMNINYATFREPDLGDQLTAVVFIVPECVYNKKDYPEFWDWQPVLDYAKPMGKMGQLIALKHNNVDDIDDDIWGLYNEWSATVMGDVKWTQLRDFLRGFKFA
jgi:hypothetical protein